MRELLAQVGLAQYEQMRMIRGEILDRRPEILAQAAALARA